MKVRNTILILIFCLLMLSPATLWVLDRAQVALPGWLTSEDATYLSGGIEESHLEDTLSLSGFASEEFQAALETELDNNTPLRADILLANATLQRDAIASSNMLFQFDAYPTFYGSGTVYIPAANALATMPTTNERLFKKITQTVDGIASIAALYPNKNFYLVVADMSDTSQANPASKLVTGALSTNDFIDVMEASLVDTPNVHIVSIPYTEASDYYQNYYRSDHHWNGFGTLKLYDKLLDVANLPYQPDESSLGTLDFGVFPTNGSYARDGLMLINEPASEPQFDMAGLSVQNEELAPVDMADGVSVMKSRGLMAEFNFYTQWYGSSLLTDQSPIVNEMSPTSRNAVVIMDSYADSLHWLLAKNYSYLRCYRDIRAGQKGDASLIERIEDTEADDIYFVGSALAYARIPKCFPHYFNQEDAS